MADKSIYNKENWFDAEASIFEQIKKDKNTKFSNPISKKVVNNYNISTQFEQQEEEKSTLDKIWDFFSWIWTWLWTSHADNNIISAQEDQYRIDSLKDKYVNWNVSDDEKQQILSEIEQLAKNRDEKLNYWHNNRFQEAFVTPITEEDIYNAIRDKSKKSPEDFKKITWRDMFTKSSKDVTSWDKSNLLKTISDKNLKEQQKTLIDEYKKDVKAWKAKADETWQWFLEWYSKKTQWNWTQWYINQFRNDVLWSITPKKIILIDDEWVQRTFFEDETAEFVDNLIHLDDLYKPIESNYNVVKKIEWWLNSDNESEREYAESEFVQNVYNNAVKNLNNLKEETAYIYNNFEKYNWDIYEIENHYKAETGRKMFSDASNWDGKNLKSSLNIPWANEWISSEDRWTTAIHRLNVDWFDHIKEEYNTIPDLVLWNIYSPIKRWWYNWTFMLNTARNSLQEIHNDALTFTNTFYNFLQDEATWWDVDYIWQLNSEKIKKSWDTNKQYVENVELWMSSMQSLKDKLLDQNEWWNKAFNSALAISDASATLWKEAIVFAITEWLINSMGVTTTSEMVYETAMWSDKYAKVVARNNWLLKFSPTEILKAKMYEFVWRWIIQNSILSASANSNFSEWYTDLDFWLDLAFWFIDVFALWYWATIWKWKIFNEAYKRDIRKTLRTALRDTWNITDDQWRILLLTNRDDVDAIAAEMWKKAVNAVKKRAEELWVTQEEVIDEMIKASKQKTETTQMLVKWEKPKNSWSNIKIEEEWYETLSKAYRNAVNAAAMHVVLSDPSKFSKSIRDKLWIHKMESINKKWEDIFPYWKSPLTYDEFAEIVEKANIPALSKLWKKFEKMYKTWKAQDIKTEEKDIWKEVQENVKTDKSTAEWQIKTDLKETERNEKYERLLKSILVWDNIDKYRRWEFEKYWRPNNFEYWDIWYTAYWKWATNAEIRAELMKRVKEYAKDYSKFFSKDKEINYTNPNDWAKLNTSSVKMSDSILWKDNLIWLSFNDAMKVNKNLAYTSEWFFISVTNSKRLELYQMNAILWSIPEWWKSVSPNWTNIILNIKKWDNNVFGSSYEEDYIVWNYWSVWIAWIRLPDWTLQKWAYIKYKDHINIIWENKSFEYNLKLKDWTITSDIDMDIWFIPPKWFRFSHDLKFYKDWKVYDKRIKEFSNENKKEFNIVEKIQRVEDILSNKWHEWTLADIETRNRYQSEDHDYYFSHRDELIKAENDSQYIDLLDIFDMPFSFFVEIKKSIAQWKIDSLKEWANKLLRITWSNIKENIDYFIIDKDALIREDTLYIMFHNAWIILLPTDEVKYWWFKPYIYEREEWINWRYNLYTSDNKDVPIWEIWVDFEKTFKTYIRFFDTNKATELTSYRLSKHNQIDVDSSRFNMDTEWLYKEKRDHLFEELKLKESQQIFNTYPADKNFDVTNPKDIADKFRIIATRWWWRTYNKDIKVQPKNKNEIKNIYNFKNLSLRIPSKWWVTATTKMFEDWLDTIKLRIYKEKLWADTIEEWVNKLKEIRRKWIDYEWERVFGLYNDATSVIIDTRDMWFSVNYIVFKWYKSNNNILAFNIDAWNNKNRIVSIWNMPNLNIKDVDWVSYLQIVDKDWINYFLRLDTTIKQQPKWKVNPLSLSDKDYKTYIEVPSIYENNIAWEGKYEFILANLEDLPSEITDMIIDWASVSDVYSYMKEIVWWNELMQWIIDSWQLDFESITLSDLFSVYKESVKLQNVINTLFEEWIVWTLDIPRRFFDYYKYITWATTISEKAFAKLFELWLWMFVDEISERNLIEWYRNIYKQIKDQYPISWASYCLDQFEITKNRIQEFLDKFNDYRIWLDLKTIEWRAEYYKRIKNWYAFATQVVKKEDVRKQFNVLKEDNKKVEVPTNELLRKLDTQTWLLKMLRIAKWLLRSRIRLWNVKEYRKDFWWYKEYKEYRSIIEDIWIADQLYDEILHSWNAMAAVFVKKILWYYTAKKALKEIDILQNIIKKRARKIIKQLNKNDIQDINNKNEIQEDNVNAQIQQDVKEVEETTQDMWQQETKTLENKAKALVNKTENWWDNSEEIKSYIDEKEKVQDEWQIKTEKWVNEYKEEEFRTEDSQINDEVKEIKESEIQEEALKVFEWTEEWTKLYNRLKELEDEDRRFWESIETFEWVKEEEWQHIKEVTEEAAKIQNEINKKSTEIANWLKQDKYNWYTIINDQIKPKEKKEVSLVDLEIRADSIIRFADLNSKERKARDKNYKLADKEEKLAWQLDKLQEKLNKWDKSVQSKFDKKEIEYKKVVKQHSEQMDLYDDIIKDKIIDLLNTEYKWYIVTDAPQRLKNRSHEIKEFKIIEEDNTKIQEENNLEEHRVVWNYKQINDLKTEDLMWFSTISLDTSIKWLLTWDTFLLLIEKLSEKEWWKMPSWNYFLKNITHPTLNKAWKDILSNPNNVWIFLKSEEWMEYMLYSLYYHLAVPTSFINKFNELFWTNIITKDDVRSWSTLVSEETTFEDAFNIVYKTYKDYFWLNIEVQQWWMINIDKWMTSTRRSFLWQYVYLWENIWDTTLKEFELLWKFESRWVKELYDTSNIIRKKKWTKEFVDSYNDYLSKALSWWSFRSVKYRSWPMSVYEYWTLLKYDAGRIKEWKESILNKIKKWDRYINPTYWIPFKNDKDSIISGGFIKMLDDPENKKEFKHTMLWYTDNQLLSPYYYNKIKEINESKYIKIDKDTKEKKEMSIMNSTITVSWDYFIDREIWIQKLKDWWITKIVIQWWNIEKITNKLNTIPELTYEVNKYLDEIEATIISVTESEIKDIENVVWKNAEDSFKATCK